MVCLECEVGEFGSQIDPAIDEVRGPVIVITPPEAGGPAERPTEEDDGFCLVGVVLLDGFLRIESEGKRSAATAPWLNFVRLSGTWAVVNTGLADLRPVSALAINPLTPTILYAGSWGDDRGQCTVIRSSDGGGTWSATGLSQSGPVTALVIDRKAPTILYAGTGDGVFKSTNSGATWRALDAGQPNTDIQAVVIEG